MPKGGELGVSRLIAVISREMKGIDDKKFHGLKCCDEIVHSALMEITTG
jgi:16S rRNA U1498 N3-methylase RsmE